MSDRILGLAGLIFALAFLYGASRIEAPFTVDPLGPRTFPAIVGAVIALSSLWPLLRPDPEPAWPDLRRGLELAAALLAMLLYAHLLRPLGFLAATVPMAAFLAWRLGGRPAMSLLYGVGAALGLQLAFSGLLGLSLPRGPLGF